jgi:hypothetical protein
MNREVHVRFWEGLAVRFPWATQLHFDSPNPGGRLQDILKSGFSAVTDRAGELFETSTACRSRPMSFVVCSSSSGICLGLQAGELCILREELGALYEAPGYSQLCVQWSTKCAILMAGAKR